MSIRNCHTCAHYIEDVYEDRNGDDCAIECCSNKKIFPAYVSKSTPQIHVSKTGCWQVHDSKYPNWEPKYGTN